VPGGSSQCALLGHPEDAAVVVGVAELNGGFTRAACTHGDIQCFLAILWMMAVQMSCTRGHTVDADVAMGAADFQGASKWVNGVIVVSSVLCIHVAEGGSALIAFMAALVVQMHMLWWVLWIYRGLPKRCVCAWGCI
jgi:hypothetical protein